MVVFDWKGKAADLTLKDTAFEAPDPNRFHLGSWKGLTFVMKAELKPVAINIPEQSKQGTRSRSKIPAAKLRAEALKRIKDKYRYDEIRTARGGVELAETLLTMSKPTSEIPAETFARGELCFTLGQKLNMPQLILQAVDQLAEHFDFDRLSIQQNLLQSSLGKVKRKEQLQPLANAVIVVASEMRREGKYDRATKFLALTRKRAEDLRDDVQFKRLSAVSESLQSSSLTEAINAHRNSPADKASNDRLALEIAKRQHWKAALPYFKNGSDPSWQLIAKSELNVRLTYEERLKTAQAWKELAQQKKDWLKEHEAIAQSVRWSRLAIQLADDVQRKELEHTIAQTLGIDNLFSRFPEPPSGITRIFTFEPGDAFIREDGSSYSRDLFDGSLGFTGSDSKFVAEGKVGRALQLGADWTKFPERHYAQAREGSLTCWAKLGEIPDRAYLYSEWSSHQIFGAYINNKRELEVATWHPDHNWTYARTPAGSSYHTSGVVKKS